MWWSFRWIHSFSLQLWGPDGRDWRREDRHPWSEWLWFHFLFLSLCSFGSRLTFRSNQTSVSPSAARGQEQSFLCIQWDVYREGRLTVGLPRQQGTVQAWWRERERRGGLGWRGQESQGTPLSTNIPHTDTGRRQFSKANLIKLFIVLVRQCLRHGEKKNPISESVPEGHTFTADASDQGGIELWSCSCVWFSQIKGSFHTHQWQRTTLKTWKDPKVWKSSWKRNQQSAENDD